MKVENYTIQRMRTANFDINTGWSEEIHVEFYAETNKSEIIALFNMLMTGHIPKEVNE